MREEPGGVPVDPIVGLWMLVLLSMEWVTAKGGCKAALMEAAVQPLEVSLRGGGGRQAAADVGTWTHMWQGLGECAGSHGAKCEGTHSWMHLCWCRHLLCAATGPLREPSVHSPAHRRLPQQPPPVPFPHAPRAHKLALQLQRVPPALEDEAQIFASSKLIEGPLIEPVH